MDETLKKELQRFAAKIRIEELHMFAYLGFGHIGGALSCTDLLAVLYGAVMKYDPDNPQWKERDRLVVSKGHGGPAVYAALALKGFFPVEMLATLNEGGTKLPSHCDNNKTRGIDMTTGSLGQGASSAAGIAEALKHTSSKVFLVLGDGECQEGQVWEMAMYASQRRLGNLIAFVDRNQKQLDGEVEKIMALGDLEAKFKAFGWNACAVDGHNLKAVYEAAEEAKLRRNGPSVIILNTLKGKGAKFVEEERYNHHMAITREQAEEAIERLKAEVEYV